MDSDKEFIDTFNEYYPFERYIVKNPKRINYLFDDAVLTELFVPSSEIKPIVHEEQFTGMFTGINTDEVYIKLLCKGVEFRMNYYDFADHIREGIRFIVEQDMNPENWQSLYCEGDDILLKDMLQEQRKLITDKYGACNLKDSCKNTQNRELAK